MGSRPAGQQPFRTQTRERSLFLGISPFPLLEARMRVLSLVPAGLLLFCAPALQAQGAPAAQATPLQWGPAPASFPAGAKMAVVSGDPSQAGPFTIPLAMPDGYRIPPHLPPT